MDNIMLFFSKLLDKIILLINKVEILFSKLKKVFFSSIKVKKQIDLKYSQDILAYKEESLLLELELKKISKENHTLVNYEKQLLNEVNELKIHTNLLRELLAYQNIKS